MISKATDTGKMVRVCYNKRPWRKRRNRRCCRPVYFHKAMIVALLILVQLVVLSSLSATASPAGNNYKLYKTLGLSKDCSSSDIKKAYRRLALKHHPDKAMGADRDAAEKKFKEIGEAYETLSDEKKRNLYDQFGDVSLDQRFAGQQQQPFGSQQQQQRGSNTGGSYSQFFSTDGTGSTETPQFSFGGFDPSMFGGSGGGGVGGFDLGDLLRKMMMGETDDTGRWPGQQRQRQQRHYKENTHGPKPSYTRNLSVTLEELASGVTKKLKVKLPKTMYNPITGKKEQQSVEEKIYKVKIKPGWKSGTKITFPSSRKNGFPEMIFIIKEKRHPFLLRKNNDIIYRCNITKEQSVSGVRVKLPLLLENESILLEIKRGSDNDYMLPIKDGHVKTIRKKGMPIKGGPERGDLKIEFHIKQDKQGDTAKTSSL